jgi:hypothetical protein
MLAALEALFADHPLPTTLGSEELRIKLNIKDEIELYKSMYWGGSV